MNKMLLVLGLAITLQVVVSAPRTKVEEANLIHHQGDVSTSDRFDLVEDVYENLQKTVWPKDVYGKATEYLEGVKSWAATNDELGASSIYNALIMHINNCLNLLKELSTDPHNCKKQWSLKHEHHEIRSLFDSVDSAKLRRGWVEKYLNFVTPLRSEIKTNYEHFYTTLSTEVQEYLNGSDQSPKDDIRVWLNKFNQENDYVKKQKLVMEFLGLFPSERQALDAKCEVQYSNGL
uniref:Uncharacterized protein n=1 Tax=Stomoxys calcitrans TaxID=35570 RepID=A0A1I8Q8D7_STOCA